MATGLTAGHSYSLSSSQNDRISVVFVKLTDSSLRSIDDYHSTKNAKRMATISFSGTIGAVSIPQKDSDAARTFDFTVHKPNNEEIHECVYQTKNKLTSLGPFTKKLQIQGNDDIYQSTIKRMSHLEEESKKQRAKEIKTSGANSASRLRKILKNVKNSQNPSSARNRQQTATAATQRKIAVVNAQPKVTPASRATAIASIQSERASPLPGGQKIPPASYPLRERIIHLLAVKSYKKPELLIKLDQDGLNEKDRDLIVKTLEQVAQLNPRDNSYVLQRHLFFSDVKQDWPLFTDADKQLLIKKQTSMCLNTSIMNPRTISPCPSNGSQGSPPRAKRSADGIESILAANKRPNSGLEGAPPPKKVRVAHNAKSDAPRPAAQAPSLRNGNPSATNSLRAAEVTKAIADSSEAIVSSSDGNIDQDDDDNFTREFAPIESSDQRSRYKTQFDSEHKEHQVIYHRILQKTAQLYKLRDQLSKELSGTPEHESLQNEIFAEYIRLKNDVEYKNDRIRYEHLLKKLEHIKKLVHNFDQSRR